MMRWFQRFTAKGKAIRRAERLINSSNNIAINLETLTICLNGLVAILDDPTYYNHARSVYISMHFTPEKLLQSIIDHTQILVNRDYPERRRYPIPINQFKFTDWFWDENEKALDILPHVERLIEETNNFVTMLRGEYKKSGKAVAGYHLEQMFFQLSDIITLTESFYRKQ